MNNTVRSVDARLDSLADLLDKPGAIVFRDILADQLRGLAEELRQARENPRRSSIAWRQLAEAWAEHAEYERQNAIVLEQKVRELLAAAESAERAGRRPEPILFTYTRESDDPAALGVELGMDLALLLAGVSE